MSRPVRIVVIGAGSASFGENTLSAILRSKKLRGSSLALVDQNLEILAIVKKLADRLNREWKSNFNITAHSQHRDALENADFVISAIEVGARENLWRKDFEIPIKHGIRQPYAENGGPGGFFHAARNIPIILGIAHDMEKICPNALFINFTNPMIRICDAVNRHSSIKAVGLCHQIYIAYTMVGITLSEDLGFDIPKGITGMHADVLQAPLHDRVKAQAVPRLDITAAGLNHFSWILSIHDRQTGEDLYPLFRKRWQKIDPDFEPLTQRVFDAFDLFPVPGDTHLCEYLPWVSDPVTKPWDKYKLKLYDWDIFASVREFSHARLTDMANGETTIEHLLDTDSEGALEIIENISSANTHYHLAANLPNQGQIVNLPIGSPVETPVIIDGAGIHPVQCGSLPEPVAELLRREITVSQLCVDAVVNGDRRTALLALLLDPIVNDIEQASALLDEYLLEYKEYLPSFWD